jgi:hypothetical protein
MPTDDAGDTADCDGANAVDASFVVGAESLHDARIRTAGKITANRGTRENVMAWSPLVAFKTRAELERALR